MEENNDQKSEHNRKRGIKASPVKIRAAMLNSGVRTQTELAKLIQETENTDSVPRSLVSRVCRGEAVDPVSIERVAAVMGVQGWELYLNTKDQNLLNQIEDNEPSAPFTEEIPITLPKPRKRKVYLGLLTIAIVSIVLTTFLMPNQKNPLPNTAATTVTKSSVVVVYQDQKNENLSRHIIAGIDDYANVVTKPLDNSTQIPHPFDVAKDYEADIVITIKRIEKDRYVNQQVWLYTEGLQRVIDYKIYPIANETIYLHSMVKKIHHAVNAVTNKLSEHVQINDEYMRAIDTLLEARLLIEQRDFQKDGDKITSMLLGALEQNNDMAQLYGALCQAYILKSWLEDEKHTLGLAQSACNKANDIDKESLYIQAVNAHLHTLTGETDKAINLFEQILKNEPTYLLALSGYAEANIQLANQNTEMATEAYSFAKQALSQAIELEQDYWYLHELLGSVFFATQETQKSLEEFTLSARYSENPVSLANVGILSLCQGFNQEAEQIFKQLQTLAPHSHLGDQFLGLLYSYQANYDIAIPTIKSALAKIGNKEGANIYDYWGYLGDAYRWSQDGTRAVEAYHQALKALKHYTLLGVQGNTEEVAALYYEVKLAEITNAISFNRDLILEKLQPLSNKTNGLSDSLKLAQILLALGQVEKAKAKWLEVSENCQFYRINPDFKSISL